MRREKLSSAFKTGAISLAFLVIGYQAALFIHQASVETIIANEQQPSAAMQVRIAETPSDTVETVLDRKQEIKEEVVRRYSERHVESFPFNPNTISLEDLQRLGFSQKQAQSIINYRNAGGRFHRPSDFARSFVVADTVFRRLEPFITIPLIDINAADSAAFDQLPGIGPYYAAKMVEYRKELEGYDFPEQLLDIWNFGQERLEGLIDLIEVGPYDPETDRTVSPLSE